MGFPTCPPPIGGVVRQKPRDKMFKDTEEFVATALNESGYSHVVIADYIERKVKEVLRKNGYVRIKQVFHSIFEESPDGMQYDVWYSIYHKKPNDN